MRIKVLSIIALLFTISCIRKNIYDSSTSPVDSLFRNRYEFGMISQGDNRPDFDWKKDSINLFLIALHKKIDQKKFQEKAGWTNEIMDEKIQFLINKGWVHESDKGLKPTVFIATNSEGIELFKYGRPLAEIIAQSIGEEIPLIKEKFKNSGLSDKYNFDSISFLVLSNVLLDNWQIRKVEELYLKKESRPMRHGKHYYACIMENTNYPREEFGIYGNLYTRINNKTLIAIYGNNREVATEKLKNNQAFCDSVLKAATTITPELNNFFVKIAEDFRPKLINILNEQNNYSHRVYQKMGYSEEITFEEFFIFWYHFIYTDATNILANNKQLTLPEEGNFFYR